MSDFDEFWKIYPRRVGKGKARDVFARSLKKAPAAHIIAGLRRQLSYYSTREHQFIPHPSTWLGQERWDDDPQPTHPSHPKPKSDFDQHQDAVQRELDRALGRTSDDEFTGKTYDIAAGDYRSH